MLLAFFFHWLALRLEVVINTETFTPFRTQVSTNLCKRHCKKKKKSADVIVTDNSEGGSVGKAH